MKEELLKALEAIKNEYDAYYFLNKYGDENTHKKEFELLSGLQGEKVSNALAWIKDCYDCYYKNELGDDSPFAYLKELIEEQYE